MLTFVMILHSQLDRRPVTAMVYSRMRIFIVWYVCESRQKVPIYKYTFTWKIILLPYVAYGVNAGSAKHSKVIDHIQFIVAYVVK